MKTVHKLPILLTLISVIGGVFISILFGANEAIFKDKISAITFTPTASPP